MSLAILIRRMTDAGATAEVLALAVEAWGARDSATDARKAKDRDRKRRSLGNSVEVPIVVIGISAELPKLSAEIPVHSEEIPDVSAGIPADSAAPRVGAPACVLYGEEVSIIPPQSTTYSSPKPSSEAKATTRKPTARDELTEVLGNELAAEIVAHRQRMRAPMTPQTAARLAKQFLDTGNPQEAAKHMMDSGWRSFKADWWQNAMSSPPARAGPLNGHAIVKLSTARALMEMSRGKSNPSPGSLFDGEPDAASAKPLIDGEFVEIA